MAELHDRLRFHQSLAHFSRMIHTLNNPEKNAFYLDKLVNLTTTVLSVHTRCSSMEKSSVACKRVERRGEGSWNRIGSLHFSWNEIAARNKPLNKMRDWLLLVVDVDDDSLLVRIAVGTSVKISGPPGILFYFKAVQNFVQPGRKEEKKKPSNMQVHSPNWCIRISRYILGFTSPADYYVLGAD